MKLTGNFSSSESQRKKKKKKPWKVETDGLEDVQSLGKGREFLEKQCGTGESVVHFVVLGCKYVLKIFIVIIHELEIKLAAGFLMQRL